MRPSFNTTGPCLPGEHYMLPPERRLARVLELIEERKYFTLHAGRQTGKTTSAFWLVDHLNAAGPPRAAWIDLETAREQPDLERALPVILGELDRACARDLPHLPRPAPDERKALLAVPERAVLGYLSALARAGDPPLVLLFDEADALVGPTLVSFLAQLRAGYLDRSREPFPGSVALIGLRPVRDYALATAEGRTVSWLGTTSPFNVSAEAATIGPFTADEVTELLAQHTAATGQRFEPAAAARIFALAAGHPWLTNALADQVVARDVTDRAIAVTADHVDAAKETIIRERRTHIDSLVARLREPRVQKILAPMIAGQVTAGDVLDDDVAYLVGLGLLTEEGGRLNIANAIYREVIPRALAHVQQLQLAQETAWYVAADGSLEVDKLLRAFQDFWRRDGHLAAEGFGYREAGPHLMLMAFLQRVVNGGGRIEREYGLGRRALDLMIEWRGDRHAIEVKLRRDTETEAEALEQVADYLELAGLDRGHLVLFDLRRDVPWPSKLTVRDVTHRGKQIRITGC
ncbi:MAG TPA: AAA-like domain-containing protein [Kofleriaceae bacterium]|nr:AAA-like domain-containing protein [Kofleriaceae bacterium]